MILKGFDSDTLRVLETACIYRNRHDKLNTEKDEKRESKDGFPQMLEKEIEKLSEKDNSNLRPRR